MAIEVYCDLCGKRIEGQLGSIETKEPNHGPRETFHYHSEECYERAAGSIVDLARAAGLQGDTDMVWKLVSKPPADGALSELDFDEFRRRGGESDLPVMHLPAWRSLIRAGAWTLEQVAALSEAELAALPDVGTKAIEILRREIHARGLEFAPEPEVAA